MREILSKADVEMLARTERYTRQVRFAPFGTAGQAALLNSRVLIVGCGALGSVLANLMTRAGAGFLRTVDPDRVEIHNLHRQTLFTEDDVHQRRFKAQAARDHLEPVNADVRIEAIVARCSADNIADLAAEMDVILDGTDNFAARYLINDWAIKESVPWVFGACAGASGMGMAVLPGQTPCLRCVFDEPPSSQETHTAETDGILGPIVTAVASFQVTEAIKILTGHLPEVSRCLWTTDTWHGRTTHMKLDRLAGSSRCPCCGQRRFTFLEPS